MKVPKFLEAIGGILALGAVEALQDAVLRAGQDARLVHVVHHKLHVGQQVHKPAPRARLVLPDN